MFEQPSFSYRDDSTIPAFDDSGPRTVMDAHCALCAHGARLIARSDKAHEFRIIPQQSPLGEAMLRHYGMDPQDPLSWLYLEDGKAYTSLDAAIRVGKRLGGLWQMLQILRIIPRPLQDMLYRFAARNRYRLFGRADLCATPDMDVQERLMQ